MKISRRELLKLSAKGSGALVLFPLLNNCGLSRTDSRSKEQARTINTWSPDTRDAALLSERWWHEAFMARNPGILVKQLTVPYGNDTVKLTAAHRAGSGVPDVVWTYDQYHYTYGIDGLISPVNDLLNEIGLDRYPAGILDGIRINDVSYTVPFVGFPFFIYYRKDLYERQGLRIPQSHDELLNNITALHEPPNRYGYILTNQAIYDTWNLRTAMWTHGAYYFDSDHQLALDREETIAAWNFYKRLGEYTPPGSMQQSDLESRELMLDGKVAHMLTTTSFAANFKDEDLKRQGAFLYPQKAGARGASIDFNGLAIPVKSKSRELAQRFIKFILEAKNFEEYLTRTEVGWIPMLKDGWNDSYLNHPRIAPVKEYLEVGRKSQETGVIGTGYFGPGPSASSLVKTDLEKQIGDRLVTLEQRPEQVLEWAVKEIRAALSS